MHLNRSSITIVIKMATIFSQTDAPNARGLTIKIPANVYHLSNIKTDQGIAHLQQLVNLATSVADGLDQIQAAIRDLECDCIINQINAPAKAYMEQLKARYPDQSVVTAALNTQGTGVAVFIGAKVRLTRSLKIHVQVIEAVLLAQGEKVKVIDVFSEDANLLRDLGSSISAMIDGFLASDGGPRCQTCGMANISRMSSLRLPTRSQPSRTERRDRSSTLAQSSASGSFSGKARRG